MNGLSYRIVDGPTDLDVTAHLQGTPELTWNAVGGCETARLRLDLPLSTFPALGRRARLSVTDQAGRPVWDGYCTDPGRIADAAGEAFELTADGSMSVASLRVGRLVYIDSELGSWTRSRSSVETAQVGQVDDETFTGWRVGHPEGQTIGTGATAGIEYRHLANADHGLGRLTVSLVGASNDPGFDVVIATYSAGVPVDSISFDLTTAPVTLDLVAGEDIDVDCDAVQIAVVRVGGATNVTTALAYIDIPALSVEGATVDQWGQLVPAGAPVTSARVVADLMGRGLLGPVDPAAAVIVDSGVAHEKLSWATGIRGAAALEELRETDTAATWMYGTRGPGGYGFSWMPWATEAEDVGDLGVRYDFGDFDEISSTGSTELPADRVLVVWTDADGEERSLTVELPAATDLDAAEFARDLDPIVLGESNATEAAQAGLDALTTKADVGRSVTVTVARQVLDRATGFRVEPHELRPGCLARLETSGDVLRVQAVTASGGEDGGTATLTLGDPPSGFEDRLLAVVRGEVDPTAPLIPPRPVTPLPPQTSAPRPPELADITTDLEELYARADENAAAAAAAAETGTAALTAANGKNKVWYSASGPGATPNTPGDIWWQRSGGLIYGQWEGLGGTAWAGRTLAGAVIAYLDAGQLTAGSAFTNALSVKTNFTLGDASTNGVIQSYNFAGSSVGVYIDKYGLVAKGGSIVGAEVIGGRIATGSSGKRAELSSSFNDLRFYDSGGIRRGTVDYVNWVSGGDSLTLTGPGFNAIRIHSGVTQHIGDLNIQGNLTISGSYPSGGGSWVGTAAGSLNMNGYSIWGASTISASGDATIGGGATFGGVLHAFRLETDVSTTGNAINTHMDANGRLFKNTSSRRYKYDVEDANLDASAALRLRPTLHRRYDDPDYDETNPGAARKYLSLIAEEVAEVSELMVIHDEEGRPDGLDVPAILLHVLAAVQGLSARLDAAGI